MSYSPMIQMGFRMKRNRPQKPMYLDRQPADHRRTRYSTPKNTTKQISIQNNVSLANSWCFSIVDRTLNIKQTRTNMNLKLQFNVKIIIIAGKGNGCLMKSQIDIQKDIAGDYYS